MIRIAENTASVIRKMIACDLNEAPLRNTPMHSRLQAHLTISLTSLMFGVLDIQVIGLRNTSLFRAALPIYAYTSVQFGFTVAHLSQPLPVNQR